MGSTRDKLKWAVRKTVKWGGAVLTLLLVVVWIGSGWWDAAWFAPGPSYVELYKGRVLVQSPIPDALMRQSALSTLRGYYPPFEWWFDWGRRGMSDVVWIPLWFPALLSLLATAAAWRADWKYLRRASVGLCAGCGYDRAGLAAGSLCPECGAGAGA